MESMESMSMEDMSPIDMSYRGHGLLLAGLNETQPCFELYSSDVTSFRV